MLFLFVYIDLFDFDVFENMLNGFVKVVLVFEVSNSGEILVIWILVLNVDLWDGDGNDDDLFGEFGRFVVFRFV